MAEVEAHFTRGDVRMSTADSTTREMFSLPSTAFANLLLHFCAIQFNAGLPRSLASKSQPAPGCFALLGIQVGAASFPGPLGLLDDMH